MKNLQHQIQTFINKVQWDWVHSGYKVPADWAALEFLHGLIKANFPKEELERHTVDLTLTAQRSIVVFVGKKKGEKHE